MNLDKERILFEIEKIYNTLISLDYKEETDFGVLSGLGGVCLFLAEKYKISREEDVINKTALYFQLIYNGFNNKEYPSFTFCSGISGVGWLVNYLSKINLFESEENNVELNNLIYQFAIHSMSQYKNYDYLHGGLGTLLYFATLSDNQLCKSEVSNIIDKAIKLSYNENNYRYWIDDTYKKNNPEIFVPDKFVNFGLAHGLPGILLLFGKAFCVTKDKKIIHIIEEGVNCILNHELEDSLSIFPSDNFHKRGSRLAWCYGDLGIANSLYILGNQLSNEKWIKKSIDIFIHASKRKELLMNSIIDAGICHGAFGISHIFRRMFFNTGIEIFSKASDYWINEALYMAKFEDGLSGYKAYHGPDKGWVKEFGLLEGIAGMGLVLLSSISKEAPNWDECLLLS
ncbi:MAG TPA: lanthionine synthetase C family protein [Bacteroidales bacterium]|nr:lanthionine synthetase C family protein [Bacteroidales bacterium]HPS18032.1 lanthionine synthetase C family protein [Bacteroidales bacterium]